MKISEMITALELIKAEEGDLPVHVPFNDCKDDFKECRSITSQNLYFGLFRGVSEHSVVLRHGASDDAD